MSKKGFDNAKHYETTIENKNRITDDLEDRGYAVFQQDDLQLSHEFSEAFEALANSFADLPPDPNCREGNRSRALSVYAYLPWEDRISPVPPQLAAESGRMVTAYYQSAATNPEDGGERRFFTPIHPAMRTNPALLELIRLDYNLLPDRSDWNGHALRVGVHLIRQEPTNWAPAFASPNRLHQDGEPYTYVHLVRRENITGGTNYVADLCVKNKHPDDVDRKHIYETFVLEKPLSGFVVDDKRVCHHVDGVDAIFPTKDAVRDVILIDFTPRAI